MNCTGYQTPLGMSRRGFLEQFGGGLGAMALASLSASDSSASPGTHLQSLHKRARAKRVIYLFQAGGPSQLELFDYKPVLKQDARHRTSGLDPQRPAADGHEWQPGQFAPRGYTIHVQTAGRVRNLDERDPAIPVKDRR